MHKITSPVSSGDNHILSTIVNNMLPSHKVWCEPYFQTGDIFFNKQPSQKEIINDEDNQIVNFYLMVKQRWEQLYFLMQSTVHCDFYLKLAEEISGSNNTDELHKAWAFWLKCQKSFVSPERWAIDDKLPLKPVIEDHIQSKIGLQLSQRLQNTYITNRNPLEVITETDGEDTLFYLQPKTKKQWKELMTILPNLKGKAIIHYDQKSLSKGIKEGWLYADEKFKDYEICTNYKREPRLFDETFD